MRRIQIFLLCSAMIAASAVLAQQAPNPGHTETLLGQLRNPDPSVRGAAKLELMRTTDPEALPALIKLAPSAKGELRANLLEILSVYKDPRKIPALIQMSRPFESEYVFGPAQEQLVELGAPAAQALMDSVPNQCDENDSELGGYKSWVARMLDQMGPPAFAAIFAGLRSGKPCKQSTASEALLSAYVRYGGASLEPDEEIERDEVALLIDAATDSDPKINETAYQWIDSAKAADFAQLDFAKFVDALIATYQANAPAEKMVEIAGLLAKVSSPRVARFMRAAVHAPNPEIQTIASNYIAEHAQAPAAKPARAPARTSEQKIHLAEELGDSDESANTPKLAKLLSDADPKVRAAAAKGLGELNIAPSPNNPHDERERDIENSIPPLMKALTDASAEVRAASAKAIGDIKENQNFVEEPDSELSARLAGLLKDPDRTVVANSARALGQIHSLAAVSGLLPLMNDADHNVRSSAALSLSEMPGPTVTCPLLSALKDEDQQIRVLAAQGLYGKFENGERCPGDVETLVAAARSGSTQFYALEVLGKLKDPRAVEPLIAEMQSFTTRSVCPECKALAKIGDKRAVAPMVKLIQDRHGDVGLEVVTALGDLKDSSAVPSILPLVKDAKPEMRAAAINALGKLGSCQQMNQVRPALSDETSQVRTAAADIAGQCKDLQSVESLVRMLPVDLIPAAKALGDIGDKRAVEPLLAVFQQKQLWGRRAVAHALGQLHDPRAVDLLIAGLHDDTKTSEPIWVGIESAWALGEIGDPRAIPALQQVVRENPPFGGSQVADAATTAVKKMGATVPAREGKP